VDLVESPSGIREPSRVVPGLGTGGAEPVSEIVARSAGFGVGEPWRVGAPPGN
jgi:hypothetical protein